MVYKVQYYIRYTMLGLVLQYFFISNSICLICRCWVGVRSFSKCLSVLMFWCVSRTYTHCFFVLSSSWRQLFPRMAMKSCIALPKRILLWSSLMHVLWILYSYRKIFNIRFMKHLCFIIVWIIKYIYMCIWIYIYICDSDICICDFFNYHVNTKHIWHSTVW